MRYFILLVLAIAAPVLAQDRIDQIENDINALQSSIDQAEVNRQWDELAARRRCVNYCQQRMNECRAGDTDCWAYWLQMQGNCD